MTFFKPLIGKHAKRHTSACISNTACNSFGLSGTNRVALLTSHMLEDVPFSVALRRVRSMTYKIVSTYVPACYSSQPIPFPTTQINSPPLPGIMITYPHVKKICSCHEPIEEINEDLIAYTTNGAKLLYTGSLPEH